MKVHISLLFIFLFTACPQPNRVTVIDNSNRVSASPENNFAATRIKKDINEGYSSTTWFRSIQNVSVRGKRIEVFTDLTSNNDAAGKICGGVSFTAYGYDGSDHTEAIIIYGKNNSVLIERNGIGEQCR